MYTLDRGKFGTGVSNIDRIVENEFGEKEDTEDDEGAGDERDIWSVGHVTEEDFETTEGESEDLYDKLMEMLGWKVTDNENENENKKEKVLNLFPPFLGSCRSVSFKF